MADEHNTTEAGDKPAAQQQSLGLAGGMARAFIHSPLSPLLFFVMLVIGVLGLIFTPRQEDPQISVPMVDIFIQYPGASSEQVASLAIDPLQRIMSEIPGVEHVYSVSRRGEGMVTVQFDVGEQLGPSIVKVHDKLQSNLDRIPPGVGMPLVKPKGIDDVPAVTLTLWSESLDDSALRTLALDLLQSLKQIPNTGQGFVVGGRPEQVRVEVMPERLSGYGLSLDQVAQTIRTANSEQQAGSMESGGSHFTVYTGSFLHTADEIARLVVSVHDGVPVYVRDVAEVFQAPAEPQQLVNYYTGPASESDMRADGVAAVTLALAKKEGTNGVTVANAIIAEVEALKGRLLPDNVNVAITRNYGETANQKVNELIFKLFVATAAVAILVWLTLGLRPALVVLFVIPVVILVTVFSAWILGYTIDRVSLFALIFSIGILVDDAIVVVENIYRRWLGKGSMDSDTAVDAVREVGNPTILATFTVIAALLPMGFVSGMMGPYMQPIPALGSVAMLFSLFAAFIFTPWLAMRMRPSMAQLQRSEQREARQSAKLEGFFRRLLVPMIENRFIGRMTLAGIIALFFLSCAMFYTTAVTVKMLPYDNKPEFSVMLDMPEGTALPVTANLTARMAEALRGFPEVTALQSYVGTAQPFDFNGMVRHYYLRSEPWQGELHVQLLDKGERERSSHAIAVAARDALTPMVREAGGRVTIVEMPPGPPVLQSIVAEVYGPTASVRREVAHKMTDVFEQAEGVADVDNYMQQPNEVWRFEVDTEKAVRQGISVDAINRNLAMAMGGHRLGDVKQGTALDPTYIIMQVPLATRAQVTRLGDLPIPTPNGSTVPLTELGRFMKVPQDPVIYHKDLRPVEYVVGDAVGRLAAPIYGMSEVEALLADYTTPDGVNLDSHYVGPPTGDSRSAFEWTGEWTVTYETFRDMGAAFAVALVLIYILVVWEFGNFTVPLVIMAPIPLTLIGIIPGHWLLGAEFTATSMIGFIALAGIIVRNSILLVDFSKHAVQEGKDVRDAVILACKTRTRPILITALALVAGSSVILFDPIFQGMAISLLFGVLVSTLLTLVVIPLGCISARKVFCPAGGGESPSCAPSKTPEQARPLGGRMVAAVGIGLLFAWNLGAWLYRQGGKLAASIRRLAGGYPAGQAQNDALAAGAYSGAEPPASAPTGPSEKAMLCEKARRAAEPLGGMEEADPPPSSGPTDSAAKGQPVQAARPENAQPASDADASAGEVQQVDPVSQERAAEPKGSVPDAEAVAPSGADLKPAAKASAGLPENFDPPNAAERSESTGSKGRQTVVGAAGVSEPGTKESSPETAPAGVLRPKAALEEKESPRVMMDAPATGESDEKERVQETKSAGIPKVEQEPPAEKKTPGGKKASGRGRGSRSAAADAKKPADKPAKRTAPKRKASPKRAATGAKGSSTRVKAAAGPKKKGTAKETRKDRPAMDSAPEEQPKRA